MGQSIWGSENVKERSSGKWAYVYLAETLSGFGYTKVDVGLMKNVEMLNLIV